MRVLVAGATSVPGLRPRSKRPKDFEPAKKLWSRGASNLVGAAQRAGVPHDEMFVRLAKWWALPAMTGNGIVPWVHIDDVAKATADALDRGRGGQMYNVVDDRPQSFGDYVRELSAKLHRPRPIPIPRRLVGMFASYPAMAFGTTWLPLSNAKAKAELGWTPIPR